ncbi:hypothetical protein ACFLSA_05170, partial [Bacteroidota bacterium]
MKFKIWIFILFTFLLSSCYDKDWQDVGFQKETPASYGLPVGAFSLVLADYIFEIDTFIKQYEDSLIYVYYQKDLASFDMTGKVDVPDISFTPFSIPIPVFGFTKDISVNETLRIDFGEPSDDTTYIDSINLKSGKLEINFSCTNLNPAEIRFTIPSIKTRDGKSFTTETFDITSENFSSDSIYLLGTDYYIDFTVPGENN